MLTLISRPIYSYIGRHVYPAYIRTCTPMSDIRFTFVRGSSGCPLRVIFCKRTAKLVSHSRANYFRASIIHNIKTMAHSSTNLDLPLLSGPIPGLLDSSQSSRLLRTPTCSLFFAAFDPLTARANNLPNLSALHIDPGSSSDRVNCKTSGKRVVIETDPESGTCSWRFVPRVKVENEVLGDEGPWPRVVVLCGYVIDLLLVCVLLTCIL